MTDEVKDMISKALRDEPPVGVDYDRVVADGRRRRTRRQAAIIGGAVLGVAAVVASAVGVSHLATSQSLTPAGPTSGTGTSTTAPAPPPEGCVMPAFTGGYSDPPAGTASAEELAESGRLTQAFERFAFPLPPGVTMTKPPLCVIRNSWGTRIDLHSPTADRTVFLEVRSRGANTVDVCPPPSKQTRCALNRLADGTTVMITKTSVGNDPVIVSVIAPRADGTLVRILETGSSGDNGRQQLLSDDALTKIATALQLKVAWSGPARPPDASERRAAELTGSLHKVTVLPNGLVVPDLSFRVSQGGYKLNADLADGKGIGNLFINLNPPDPAASVVCRGESGCELITMPDGRKATVTRQADGAIQRIMLNTLAADGTQVSIMASNQSVKAQTQGNSVTRSTPTLSVDDLIRIAAQSWLRW